LRKYLRYFEGQVFAKIINTKSKNALRHQEKRKISLAYPKQSGIELIFKSD